MFHIFDKVKVRIMLDSSNLQHQKIRMLLVEPQVKPNLHCPCCDEIISTQFVLREWYSRRLFLFNDKALKVVWRTHVCVGNKSCFLTHLSSPWEPRHLGFFWGPWYQKQNSEICLVLFHFFQCWNLHFGRLCFTKDIGSWTWFHPNAPEACDADHHSGSARTSSVC